MTSQKKTFNKSNSKKMQISPKKTSASPKQKTPVEKFVHSVRSSKKIWGIHGIDGWAVCDSALFDNIGVIPFWSTKKAAAVHCVEEWAGYTATAIAFDDFLDFWLVELANDGVLFGPDWNAELKGEEVNSVDLEAEFLLHRKLSS